MTRHHWWQSGVIYQIYPRSFQDNSGDGIGDLEGIAERLCYLKDTLGVQAIWISPFYPSPMKDFGYDVADYCNVDPIFGDIEAFDRLLARCHERGLRVIIDLVPNHTSKLHPWFVQARSGRQSPRRNFYVWADPAPDGGPPNNWLAAFGGPAWTWDRGSGQYYLHSFLAEQPDLNWREPAVKEAIFDVVRFWLKRGVDGFRIDVAHLIMKDPQLRDNPPAPPRDKGFRRFRGPYDEQLHINDRDHPDIHPVFRELRRLLDSHGEPGDRVSIGEIHLADLSCWSAYYGRDLDELHMPFNFSLLEARWRAEEIAGKVEALEAALPEGAWPNYVLGNHDEPRIASRYGQAQARIAAMLLLTLRGTPTLYYGDELGLTDVEIPPEQRQDPAGRQSLHLSRDPCRTPMPWIPGPGAGFTRPGVAPWLPLGPDHEVRNVERQMTDPCSMLQLYRRLLALRLGSAALRWGSYRTLGADRDGCFVFERRHESERLVVALNFTAVPREVDLGRGPRGSLLLSTTCCRMGPEALHPLRLEADEGVVVDVEGAWEK